MTLDDLNYVVGITDLLLGLWCLSVSKYGSATILFVLAVLNLMYVI